MIAKPSVLITPYGGPLVDLFADQEERSDLLRRATELDSIQLSARSLCDLEMLATGAFSPLTGFLGEADYRSVLGSMYLADGTLFPIPITLPAGEEGPKYLGKTVALRSAKNNLLALMKVEEVYECDRMEEARLVCGTADQEHPVAAEMRSWGRFNLSGPLHVLELPKYHDFNDLRHSPAQVRRLLEDLGHENTVAFQTRGALLRVHEEMIKRALDYVPNAALLVQCVSGMATPGDLQRYTAVQVHRRCLRQRFRDRSVLGLVPLATRLAGPREALWHAIIRRNYGANYFVVGRAHGSPDGRNSEGRPFHGPYEAIETLQRYAAVIGVEPVVFRNMVYLPKDDRYEEMDRVPANVETVPVSGASLHDEYLAEGRALPEWAARPEAREILAKGFPARHERGFCLWFTGLPSAGKSTIAEILAVMLMEYGRQITLLDGDVIRTHLSKGLGFSREDRDNNIRRIAFVAGEIVRHHGAVICAAVSPFASTRGEARRIVGEENFVLVYVATPSTVCEDRDVKGLYAKARAGEIHGFTGVDDPYEPPSSPDVVLDTQKCTPEQNARQIVDWMICHGFLSLD